MNPQKWEKGKRWTSPRSKKEVYIAILEKRGTLVKKGGGSHDRRGKRGKPIEQTNALKRNEPSPR